MLRDKRKTEPTVWDSEENFTARGPWSLSRKVDPQPQGEDELFSSVQGLILASFLDNLT
jgi:hypothetical protein